MIRGPVCSVRLGAPTACCVHWVHHMHIYTHAYATPLLLMLYRHVCPKGPQKGRGTIRYTPEISREHLDRVRDHNVPSTNNLSLDSAPLTRTRTFTHKRAHPRARTYTQAVFMDILFIQLSLLCNTHFITLFLLFCRLYTPTLHFHGSERNFCPFY